MPYQTTTEAAAEIRAALKEKGWSSRQVSMRARYYSMGSSIDVELRDWAVPYYQVEAIAEEKAIIHRDESGEILGGGNRFVHVNVSEEFREKKAAPYLDAVLRAAGDLLVSFPDGTLIPVGPGFLLGLDSHSCRLTLWDETSQLCQRDGAIEIAYRLALDRDRKTGLPVKERYRIDYSTMWVGGLCRGFWWLQVLRHTSTGCYWSGIKSFPTRNKAIAEKRRLQKASR